LKDPYLIPQELSTQAPSNKQQHSQQLHDGRLRESKHRQFWRINWPVTRGS